MLLVVLLGVVGLVGGYIAKPGPYKQATSGEVWPLPQSREKLDGFFVVRPAVFKFKPIAKNCDILLDAFERYWGIIVRYGALKERIIVEKYSHKQKKHHIGSALDDSDFHGYLDYLEVYLQNACDDELPTFDMDESYFLNITLEDNPKALLTAKTIWGTLRGLETFTQLIHLAKDQTTLIINATNIHDYPRFPHRGLLLDTSRHFIPVPFILQTLDAMSYNKMNVFHWHIIDDQSFPYQSEKFPELSDQGAYHSSLAVYSAVDVQKVLRYATHRGIRVIPEIDIPAHTRSWGVAVPELLARCYKNGEFDGDYGPLDPSRNFTYSFLEDILGELGAVFPDEYLHLGGDEAEFDCWKTNPDINSFMDNKNITGDYPALENYFFQRIFNGIDNLNKIYILWEEVFQNNIKVPNTTLIQIWKDNYVGMLKEVTSAGNYALLSSCWYLDHLDKSWSKMYECDPRDFAGTDEQKELVLGGEACMWAEGVNEYNLISRVWPRASAVAEVLWSAQNASTLDFAARRIEEHTCRMNDRGIHAQPPNGPGYCL